MATASLTILNDIVSTLHSFSLVNIKLKFELSPSEEVADSQAFKTMQGILRSPEEFARRNCRQHQLRVAIEHQTSRLIDYSRGLVSHYIILILSGCAV
jgi:hypothetical protein